MTSQTPSLSPSQLALLPQSKMDTAAISRLTLLPTATLSPLIPHLLTWIQDSNWPVAFPIVELLLKYPTLVVEPVQRILRDEAGEADDGGWKYNCLTFLVKEMESEYIVLLKEEIGRMVRSPTRDEREWEIGEVAGDILRGLDIAEGTK